MSNFKSALVKIPHRVFEDWITNNPELGGSGAVLNGINYDIATGSVVLNVRGPNLPVGEIQQGELYPVLDIKCSFPNGANSPCDLLLRIVP